MKSNSSLAAAVEVVKKNLYHLLQVNIQEKVFSCQNVFYVAFNLSSFCFLNRPTFLFTAIREKITENPFFSGEKLELIQAAGAQCLRPRKHFWVLPSIYNPSFSIEFL